MHDCVCAVMYQLTVLKVLCLLLFSSSSSSPVEEGIDMLLLGAVVHIHTSCVCGCVCVCVWLIGA